MELVKTRLCYEVQYDQPILVLSMPMGRCSIYRISFLSLRLLLLLLIQEIGTHFSTTHLLFPNSPLKDETIATEPNSIVRDSITNNNKTYALN